MFIIPKLSRTWCDFWFSEFDPEPLGLMRISMGFLILGCFLCLRASWWTYYNDLGIPFFGTPGTVVESEDVWSIFYWTRGFISVEFFWWFGVLDSVCFTLGWQTRVWTPSLYILLSSMIHRNRMVVNGEDLVLRMMLFYSIFLPLGCSF